MLERFLYWAGGIVSISGAILQMYPALSPMYGNYMAWSMMILGVATFSAGFFVKARKADVVISDESQSLFNQSIKAENNSGTISPTYNNNFQIGVNPTFDFIQEPIKTMNDDGSMTTKMIARISSPASRLTIKAQGRNLVSMNISRPSVRGASTTVKQEVRRWADDGSITESFASPSGTYEINIQTKDNVPPRIAHEIEN